MDPELPARHAQPADRLAQATQSLADALSSLDGQFASLHAKIDRIVAAVDEGELQASRQPTLIAQQIGRAGKGQSRSEGQSATARRKTLSPVVTALLAKEGVEGDALSRRQWSRKLWPASASSSASPSRPNSLAPESSSSRSL